MLTSIKKFEFTDLIPKLNCLLKSLYSINSSYSFDRISPNAAKTSLSQPVSDCVINKSPFFLEKRISS